jgi:NifU-like protein involved in Fe-S cluster formation
MNKLQTQAKEMNIDCNIKINNIRHQYKGSECGVYSINFIVEQLKNKSFEKVTRKIVDDDKMLNRRKKFFSFI